MISHKFGAIIGGAVFILSSIPTSGVAEEVETRLQKFTIIANGALRSLAMAKARVHGCGEEDQKAVSSSEVSVFEFFRHSGKLDMRAAQEFYVREYEAESSIMMNYCNVESALVLLESTMSKMKMSMEFGR